MVYYIGQEEGELYDLTNDADELWNLWTDPKHEEIKTILLTRLLDWMASSVYWNAGYRRDGSRTYTMRWPSPENQNLQGPQGPPAKKPKF